VHPATVVLRKGSRPHDGRYGLYFHDVLLGGDENDPWFVLKYNEGKKQWMVGIAYSMLMGDDFSMMLRIDHDPPQTVGASK
jgi:hypothetical protein